MLDIVLRRRLDIVAERRHQVGIVVQIVIGAEAVAIAALTRAVDDVVRAAGVAVGAEGADQVTIAGDVLQTVEVA